MNDLFRKKPVTVQAFQLFPAQPVPLWLSKAVLDGRVVPQPGGGALIKTLEDGPNGEAKHFADKGDWIIKGVKGELYPCKPDIFEATYESVDNPH